MRSTATEQRGAVLLPVVITGLTIAFLTTVISMNFQSSLTFLKDDRTVVRLRSLAIDARELTKHLVLSEKYVRTDRPFEMASHMKIRELWGLRVSDFKNDNMQLGEACGGYDITLRYIGTGLYDGHPMFCPQFLRNPLVSGGVMQEVFFEKWAEIGVVRKDPAHFYEVKFDMTEDIFGDDETYLNLPDVGFLQDMANVEIEKVEGIVKFHLNRAGFPESSSRRYFTVEGVVEGSTSTDGNNKQYFRITDKQNLSIVSNTLREFVIFNLWPTEVNTQTRTRLWSQSMRLSPDVDIYGKVYFNGDIDVPLEQLPTFHETVILAGSFTVSVLPSQSQLMKEKFRKGVITHFSAERFILDGEYPGVGVDILNGAELNSEYIDLEAGAGAGPQPMTMAAYIDANAEWGVLRHQDFSLSSSGVSSCECTSRKDGAACARSVGIDEICGRRQTQAFVLEGGAGEVSLENFSPFVAIASPVVSLKGSGDGAIYGSVMTGFISLSGNVDMYSIGSLRVGLPGIATQEYLDNDLNPLLVKAYMGIGVPLQNLSMVTSSNEVIK